MLNKMANEARKSIIKMIYEAKSGHPGGSLSCIDILMYLYLSLIHIYGGKERQDSVYNGLQVVDQDHVLIHDGARPYITTEKIDDLLLCLKEYDACLLMVPVKDTIKLCCDDTVEVTLPRARLMQAQTPQAFKTSLIKVCYQQAQDSGFIATDDASLVEEFSTAPVKVVIGSYENIKITTPEDL